MKNAKPPVGHRLAHLERLPTRNGFGEVVKAVVRVACPFCGEVGAYDRENAPGDGYRCPCGAEVSFVVDHYVDVEKTDVERRVRKNLMHDEFDLEGFDAHLRVEFGVVPAVYTVTTGDDDYVATLVIDALFGRHVR